MATFRVSEEPTQAVQHEGIAREHAVEARERAVITREQVMRAEELASELREGAVLSREDAVLLSEAIIRAREREAEREVDLKEANERLTLMVLRSQELAEQAEEARWKLEHSEGQLRQGLEFRERLIGIVSHDLRNPIGAVSMALALLVREAQLNERGLQLAGRIGRSTERMREMVVQLLDFTRAQTGAGIPVFARATNLEKVSRQVIEELEMRHSTPDRFVCDFHGNLDGVWDADRLGQVVSNLCGNAIHHGAPGTPIFVTAVEDGDQVLLTVQNQGEPIPQDTVPFIFDPFLRAKVQGPAVGDGLGLGLHIASEIARGHGGSITACSSAEGTTFSVRLPRVATVVQPRRSAPRRLN